MQNFRFQEIPLFQKYLQLLWAMSVIAGSTESFEGTSVTFRGHTKDWELNVRQIAQLAADVS